MRCALFITYFLLLALAWQLPAIAAHELDLAIESRGFGFGSAPSPRVNPLNTRGTQGLSSPWWKPDKHRAQTWRMRQQKLKQTAGVEHPSKHQNTPKQGRSGSSGAGTHATSKRDVDSALAPRASGSDKSQSPSLEGSRSRSPSPQSPPHHAEVHSRPPASGHPSHTTHSDTSGPHPGDGIMRASGIRPAGRPVTLQWSRYPVSHISVVPDHYPTTRHPGPAAHRPANQSPIRLVPSGNRRPAGTGSTQPQKAGKGRMSEEERREKNKKFKADSEQKHKHADHHNGHSPKGSPPGSPGAGSHAVSKRDSQEALDG